jgi:hypothetical protein
MFRPILAALLAAAAFNACATATPEQQIVNDAASALGGRGFSKAAAPTATCSRT